MDPPRQSQPQHSSVEIITVFQPDRVAERFRRRQPLVEGDVLAGEENRSCPSHSFSADVAVRAVKGHPVVDDDIPGTGLISANVKIVGPLVDPWQFDKPVQVQPRDRHDALGGHKIAGLEYLAPDVTVGDVPHCPGFERDLIDRDPAHRHLASLQHPVRLVLVPGSSDGGSGFLEEQLVAIEIHPLASSEGSDDAGQGASHVHLAKPVMCLASAAQSPATPIRGKRPRRSR